MFKSKVIYKKILFLLCSLFIITFYFYGIYKYYILLQQSQQNINILQKQNNIVTNTIKEQRNKIIELTNENNELVLKNEQITAQYNDVTNKDIRTYLGEFTLTYYCISGTTASGHPTII